MDVWCENTIRAAMSLVVARKPSASKSPAAEASSRLARPSSAGTALPMCSALPLLPVTNQPPQRSGRHPVIHGGDLDGQASDARRRAEHQQPGTPSVSAFR
jgi:hypothetical protein